ncbi:MAG: polymorphic toxin type 44 domain-containing protein [Negativicutes bacterium]|nr:polymorphic toxin type 44 domain-containing protein [Negativicutes bacterium]
MGLWEVENAAQAGYPEDYLNWYYGTYKPQTGENAVSLGDAFGAWQAQNEDLRRRPQQIDVPEGTLVDSRDTGSNAAYIDQARDYIPEATDRLNQVMTDAEGRYKEEKDVNYFTRLDHFKNLLKSNAEYDLKTKPGWKQPQYVINGEVVDNDVPGNINYGYLGKVFGFPEPVLTKAAGLYQILTDLKNGRNLEDIARQFNLDSFGDDPRDTARIRQGIKIYEQSHPKPEEEPDAQSDSLYDWLKSQGY